MIVRRTKSFSKTKLSEVKSKKKNKSIPGISGLIYGKKAANKADEDKRPDIEIIEEAKKAGRKAGGIAGTITGTGIGGFGAYKGIRWINGQTEEKAAAAAEKAAAIAEQLGGKATKINPEFNANFADFTEKAISEGLKKHKKALTIGTLGLGTLTALKVRKKGKEKGEESAERNTVDRLIKRHELDKMNRELKKKSTKALSEKKK